jgi:hypothetical protein
MHIASTDRRRLWATMALDWAKTALHAAEQNANSDEIITLCEEVIKGRLRVLQCDIDAGWEPPADVRLQIARDKELLRQANEKNGVYYA